MTLNFAFKWLMKRSGAKGRKGQEQREEWRMEVPAAFLLTFNKKFCFHMMSELCCRTEEVEVKGKCVKRKERVVDLALLLG